MTLTNLCNLADAYYIAKHKYEINQDHIASSNLIYSDGTSKHHVNNDGYIHITSVDDASYLIYLDQEGNVFLWIYELTPEIRYKEIIDNMNTLRSITGMQKHSIKIQSKLINNKKESINKENPKEEKQELKSNKSKKEIPESITIEPIKPKRFKREDDIYLSAAPSEIVDVNNLECTECKSKEFSIYVENDDYSIECTCDHCGTSFVLIPSKYFIIKSKTIPTNMKNNEIIPYLIHRRSKEENND